MSSKLTGATTGNGADSGAVLTRYQQSLTAARAVGDRTGEGANLNHLGHRYATLDQKSKALDCCLHRTLAHLHRHACLAARAALRWRRTWQMQVWGRQPMNSPAHFKTCETTP